MIDIKPDGSLKYCSVKYQNIEDMISAIHNKNHFTDWHSTDGMENIQYPQNSYILCWLNQETRSYPFHWHSAVEIIMPLDNTYTVRINDGTIHHLNTGDILVIPPGALHELIAPASGLRLVLLINYTSISKLPGFSTICSLLAAPIQIVEDQIPAIYLQCRTILLSILNLYVDDEPYWDLSICSLFIQLLVQMHHYYTQTNTLLPQLNSGKQREYIHKFNLVFEYIDSHYMEELDLETVSDIAGFSKFHFSRLFRQFTNSSFNDYVNTRRIQAAIAMLASSEKSITEIALASGFPSISTFNRVFRNIKKCTPTEFKKFQT